MDKVQLEEGSQFALQFEKRGGLLPVVVQESSTGQILIVASANQEAVEKTLKTRKATFWSTSRNQIWTKGETSGNSLLLDEILTDCDQDALIYKVTIENGGACHTFNQAQESRKSCFYRKLDLQEGELVFLER